MPDQEIADAIENLLDRLGVSADRRALVYRQLIARQLVARGATPRPARDRVGSEHQPLENRDYLRKSSDDVVGWGPDGARPTAPRDATKATTRRTSVARVLLYDLDQTLPNIVGTVQRRLEAHLTSLGRGTQWDGLLAQLSIEFIVEHTANEPSAVAKRALRPLDYPIYFIDERKDQVSVTIARLHRLMDEHEIPTVIPGSRENIRSRVSKDWGGGLRGISVAPGKANVTPFRKCTFFKGRDLTREINGNPTFLANAILHEFGHLNNITGPDAHPKDGSVMQSRLSPAAMAADILPYNPAHLTVLMTEIGRLWRAQQSH